MSKKQIAKEAEPKVVVKTLQLSQEEQNQLKAVRNIVSYLTDLLEADMNRFVDVVVKPRLAISKETLVRVKIGEGTIEYDEQK